MLLNCTSVHSFARCACRAISPLEYLHPRGTLRLRAQLAIAALMHAKPISEAEFPFSRQCSVLHPRRGPGHTAMSRLVTGLAAKSTSWRSFDMFRSAPAAKAPTTSHWTASIRVCASQRDARCQADRMLDMGPSPSLKYLCE